MPIYGPLEAGETPDGYENRFAEWLHDTHNVRLESVKRGDPLVESKYHCQFPWQKFCERGRRGEAKRPRDPIPPEDMATSKRGRFGDHAPPVVNDAEEGTPGDAVKPEPTPDNDSNKPKPVGAMSLSEPDNKRTTEDTSLGPSAVDHANCEIDFPAAVARLAMKQCAAGHPGQDTCDPASDLVIGDDPIETRLWNLYTSQNQRVREHESFFETSTARLFRGVADTDEMQRLQDERDGLHDLLRLAVKTRASTVAVLVAYLRRLEIEDLKRLVKQTGFYDSPLVQRASHEKCAEWAVQIKRMQSAVSHFTEELNSVMSCIDASGIDSESMLNIARTNGTIVAKSMSCMAIAVESGDTAALRQAAAPRRGAATGPCQVNGNRTALYGEDTCGQRQRSEVKQ